jgi:hypothetical protein
MPVADRSAQGGEPPVPQDRDLSERDAALTQDRAEADEAEGQRANWLPYTAASNR